MSPSGLVVVGEGLQRFVEEVLGVRSGRFWVLLALLCAVAVAWPTAYAQDDDASEEPDEAAEVEASSDEAAAVPEELQAVEEVVVTGSRLKRDTYTSITPLQIITAEVTREAGLIDAGEILQEASTASGVQFDLTFEGFVLDDGPGSVTANLRGLGASRTLVLLNGRRLAPGGVEGAPSSPDLAVVPGLLVQQYDQLLDGASSIYGSDAVAGVINAILRKDFDGFTFEATPNFPAHGAGDVMTYGVTWGRNWDRGFVGVGVQRYDQEHVTLADRPWTAGCERHVEVDQGGRIRTTDLNYSTFLGMEPSDCYVFPLTARLIVPFAGLIYYTPGYTNGGWPNFSESSAAWRAGQFGIDGDGDGKTDINFRDYSLNGRTQFAHLVPKYRSTHAMAYGEYTVEGEFNLTPYFEVLHGESDYFIDSGQLTFWPWVPARNPYNLCNPEASGVDCGLAMDALYANPGYIAGFNGLYGELCAAIGVPATACGPRTFGIIRGAIGPQRVRVDVAVPGDRNTITRETAWRRVVLGVNGDLPFLNVGSLSGWSFDASLTHSHNSGTALRRGIRRDRLELALGYYSENWIPCENNISEAVRATRQNSSNNPLAPITSAAAAPGCLPVNLFAPSLYAGLIGDFATAAERDYLFDDRAFETIYKQTLLSLYLTGDLFDMPAGPVAGGLGMEFRKDEIESIPDEVARDGLIWNFFADGGAVGDKLTREFFGEVELPLVAGQTGAEEVIFNVSMRFTDDEFYGGAWTGAAKIGWRPIESLLVRGTFGTSYRAPNLRELFLRSQTGFLSINDPCYVPDLAIEEDLTGGAPRYNPTLDPREEHVLRRCREEGVDPTVAGGGTFTAYGVEVAAGGSLTLDEETSESKSFGFAWEQPFTDKFNLTLGLTYYEIDIEDTIIEPSIGYIVYDCYVSQESSGSFCGRITRNLSNVADPRIRLIDVGFINRDLEKVRGVDLNLAFDTTFTVFERPVDLSFEVTGHRLIERSALFVSDAGERTEFDSADQWFYAEHKAQMNMRLDYDRWRLTWSSRYLGNYENYDGGDEEWGSIYGGTDQPIPFSSTCLGPPDDLLCKDLEYAGDYWLHSTSLRYGADTWLVRMGVRNVFDISPPQVDRTAVWSDVNNSPRGMGYDFDGRVFFATARINFGGGA